MPGRSRATFAALAPIAQLAEAADLKSAQSGFESQWGHGSWCSSAGSLTADRGSSRGPPGPRRPHRVHICDALAAILPNVPQPRSEGQ